MAVIPSKLSAQNAAVFAALVPVHSVHEMIYQQLAAALEQLRKSSRPLGLVHRSARPKLLPQGATRLSDRQQLRDISDGPVTGRGEPSAWRDLVRTCSARFRPVSIVAAMDPQTRQCYPDLSWALSIGSFRTRLPVAAKIALATAGITADVPAHQRPGTSELLDQMDIDQRRLVDAQHPIVVEIVCSTRPCLS